MNRQAARDAQLSKQLMRIEQRLDLLLKLVTDDPAVYGDPSMGIN